MRDAAAVDSVLHGARVRLAGVLGSRLRATKAAHVDPDRYRSRNLVQRISNLLRKDEDGELNLTPWQISEVQEAIEQLEEERFAGERTMSEAERADLYEPAGYVAAEPIVRRHLVDELAAVVAAA